jgi:hypothetical protein
MSQSVQYCPSLCLSCSCAAAPPWPPRSWSCRTERRRQDWDFLAEEGKLSKTVAGRDALMDFPASAVAEEKALDRGLVIPERELSNAPDGRRDDAVIHFYASLF